MQWDLLNCRIQVILNIHDMIAMDNLDSKKVFKVLLCFHFLMNLNYKYIKIIKIELYFKKLNLKELQKLKIQSKA